MIYTWFYKSFNDYTKTFSFSEYLSFDYSSFMKILLIILFHNGLIIKQFPMDYESSHFIESTKFSKLFQNLLVFRFEDLSFYTAYHYGTRYSILQS